MLDRCSSPRPKLRAVYGDRGIRVCARWLSSFEAFLADMGERPEGMTIDRVDNSAGYDCGKCEDCAARGVTKTNCRWATGVEQQNNRRSNRLITIGDRTMTIADWCRERGIKYTTARRRLDAGWPPDRAFVPPAV